MFGLSRFERFVRAVMVKSREDWGGVVIYETAFPEMANSSFRKRVMDHFRDHPKIILPLFCAWEEWTFCAERRPVEINPGCCRLCNHPFIRDNRCERVGCETIQKLELGAIDLG